MMRSSLSTPSPGRPAERLSWPRSITAVLLLVLLLASACNSAAMREAAQQLDAALQAAATLEAGGSLPPTRVAPAATRPQATAQVKATATARPRPGISGLPTIAYDDLPRQARQTIELIDQGGPFPFNADDSVFQNRERLLPRQPNGYYREYTVVTPGSDDRGARRIVAGAEGELYYTDDHYDSFREVIR